MQIDFPNHQGDIFKLRVLSDQNPNPKDIQLTVTKDRDNQQLRLCHVWPFCPKNGSHE